MVEKLKSQGNCFYKDGNYQEAIDAYTKALLIDGENSTLYSNRSAALSRIGRFREALGDACQCVQHSKGWSKGYLRKVVALEGLKDYPSVMEAAEEGYKCSVDGQMKREFVKRWFSANQIINTLPPNSIEIPGGIYILSQKYLNILIHLLRSINGEHPLTSDTAKLCIRDCIEQMDTLLKCFGEPIEDTEFLYDWANNLICDIYPYIPNPTNKEEMRELLYKKTEKVIEFFKDGIDSSLYPLLRPLFALIVLIVLNRTNILTETNTAHHSAELMNRALIPFFEMDILNTREYQYLYIGRLCAVLDSFIGRTYKLSDSEKVTVKFYYKKLQKAIDEYPTDLPDHLKYRALGEKCMENIDCNVLDPHEETSLASVEEITTSNAVKVLELGNHKEVQLYVAKRYNELASIEFLTMAEVEELLTLTELFLKLKSHTLAIESFKKGEKAFFDVLGRLLEKNALKIDQCSTTIAVMRQHVFDNVRKLSEDTILYSDVAFRWKGLFTQIRALFINFGLRGIFSEFFSEYIDSLGKPSKDDDFLMRTLANQMEKEERLLQAVANKVMNVAYSCKYEAVLKFLNRHSLLIDYIFFTSTECTTLMEATCIIIQQGNDPVICKLDYSKIRTQSAMAIDILLKARKLYWSKKDVAYTGRVYTELKLLADVLLPDILIRKLLSSEVEHLYVSLEGNLSLVPYSMLPVGEEGMFMDQLVSISYLGSIHQLSANQDVVISDQKEQLCYVISDPNFDCQLPKPVSFFTDIVTMLSQYLNIGDSTGTVIEQLQGSKSEADFVSYMLCSKQLKVEQWLNDDANLKNLMSLHQPLLLHVCTHAYSQVSHTNVRGNFFTDLKCGLALAGFNTFSKKLYDQVVPECSLGQFPALAVLSLDLHGTKLVFLSTCNSGSGMVSTQEELASLSSAFLTAGAETVVATLWPVNDASAAEFSKYFYDFLLNDTGVRPSQALAYASKKLSEDQVWSHWSHWGGYVCYGLDKPFFTS